jgi:hypothetical protein
VGQGDSAQLRRTVVALRVRAPNALGPIEEMIPIIYPGVRLSYGKVQSMAAEAEAQAALFNAKADLSGVRAGALDELFSQGEPVLGGVDLDRRSEGDRIRGEGGLPAGRAAR